MALAGDAVTGGLRRHDPAALVGLSRDQTAKARGALNKKVIGPPAPCRTINRVAKVLGDCENHTWLKWGTTRGPLVPCKTSRRRGPDRPNATADETRDERPRVPGPRGRRADGGGSPPGELVAGPLSSSPGVTFFPRYGNPCDEPCAHPRPRREAAERAPSQPAEQLRNADWDWVPGGRSGRARRGPDIRQPRRAWSWRSRPPRAPQSARGTSRRPNARASRCVRRRGCGVRDDASSATPGRPSQIPSRRWCLGSGSPYVWIRR